MKLSLLRNLQQNWKQNDRCLEESVKHIKEIFKNARSLTPQEKENVLDKISQSLKDQRLTQKIDISINRERFLQRFEEDLNRKLSTGEIVLKKLDKIIKSKEKCTSAVELDYPFQQQRCPFKYEEVKQNLCAINTFLTGKLNKDFELITYIEEDKKTFDALFLFTSIENMINLLCRLSCQFEIANTPPVYTPPHKRA